MNTYLYIEMNTFAIIILILVYMNLNKTDKHMTEQKLYIHILLFTVAILIFDTFSWACDGINTPFFKAALHISTIIYFLLQPMICLLWTLYIDFQVNRSRSRMKKLILPLSVPTLINTYLCFLSIFRNIIFYFDDNNSYHRGQYFILLPIIIFTYAAYSLFYLIKNRRRIQNNYFKTFLIFTIPPIAGAVIQFMYYGLSLIWVGMTISIFIIFLNIQNQQMYSDYLTGLYNRRQLDFYLQEVVSKNKIKIAGILLDFNSFKSINDSFGHSIGDEALKYSSFLLKKSFKHHSFISRFGGDEFVILLQVKDNSDLEHAIDNFRINVEQFNSEKKLPYKIGYSIGADIYPKDSKMTGQEFLNHIDALMYKEKQAIGHVS